MTWHLHRQRVSLLAQRTKCFSIRVAPGLRVKPCLQTFRLLQSFRVPCEREPVHFLHRLWKQGILSLEMRMIQQYLTSWPCQWMTCIGPWLKFSRFLAWALMGRYQTLKWSSADLRYLVPSQIYNINLEYFIYSATIIYLYIFILNN